MRISEALDAFAVHQRANGKEPPYHHAATAAT
jgi:hypothetical protein